METREREQNVKYQRAAAAREINDSWCSLQPWEKNQGEGKFAPSLGEFTSSKRAFGASFRNSSPKIALVLDPVGHQDEHRYISYESLNYVFHGARYEEVKWTNKEGRCVVQGRMKNSFRWLGTLFSPVRNECFHFPEIWMRLLWISMPFFPLENP